MMFYLISEKYKSQALNLHRCTVLPSNFFWFSNMLWFSIPQGFTNFAWKTTLVSWIPFGGKSYPPFHWTSLGSMCMLPLTQPNKSYCNCTVSIPQKNICIMRAVTLAILLTRIASKSFTMVYPSLEIKIQIQLWLTTWVEFEMDISWQGNSQHPRQCLNNF